MGENHTLTPPPSLAWQLCIQVPCMAISYFFEKSPLGYRLPLLTSPQLSTQSNSLARDYLGHGQPWNISFPSSRGHPAPQFLWYCPSQRPVPQLGYAASCVSPTVFLLPPPPSLHVQISAGTSLRLPCSVRGATRWLSLT